MWVDPVIDRSQADVEFANANRDSSLPLKGARNHTDLNRIGGNLRHVRDLLIGLGHSVPEMTSRDNWTMTDIPRESDIDKIRADVAVVRAAEVTLSTTPTVPTLPLTHYQKLNDIERILLDINELAQKITNTSYRVGEIYVGEKIGVL